MYYTIYKTTNKINGKIYVGKHQTKKLDDDYIGSGKQLRYAISKYGVENFEKEILFCFENENDMNAKEAELVTEEFCLREDTYNICPGGNGGWSYVIANNHHTKRNSDFDRRKRVAESHKGKKRSDAHKKAISESLKGRDCYWLKGKKRPGHSIKLSGGNNPTAIKIEYAGKIYETIKDMSSETNISYYLIKKMINSGDIKVHTKTLGE